MVLDLGAVKAFQRSGLAKHDEHENKPTIARTADMRSSMSMSLSERYSRSLRMRSTLGQPAKGCLGSARDDGVLELSSTGGVHD